MPTKRRVYAPDGSKQKILNPVLVAIDISDIAFSADSDAGKQSRGDREKHATASRAAVNMRSIFDSNQFQIVCRKDFPFRVVYLHPKGFSGAFVQNLKTFLAAGEEMTFTPLAQSNDDREQLPAFLG